MPPLLLRVAPVLVVAAGVFGVVVDRLTLPEGLESCRLALGQASLVLGPKSLPVLALR